MSKIIIGVIPLYDEKKESIWMLPNYMEALEESGAIPIILPFSDNKENIIEICKKIDGLLVTGGQDVNPNLYDEEKIEECGTVCDIRDRMEKLYLGEMFKLDKPVFGICRGLQFLNVYMGGSLYQDIAMQFPTKINHRQKPPFDKPVHNVQLKDGILKDLYKEDEIAVNSYHHQGIKKLGKNLQVLAFSEDDIIEAIQVKNKKFIMAVQWHPEYMYKTDDKQRKLFELFVKQCE